MCYASNLSVKINLAIFETKPAMTDFSLITAGRNCWRLAFLGIFVWILFIVMISANNNDQFYITPCILKAVNAGAITAITTRRAISCPQNCPGKMLRSRMLEPDSSITMKMFYCPDAILLPPKNCKTWKWESGNNPALIFPSSRFLQ